MHSLSLIGSTYTDLCLRRLLFAIWSQPDLQTFHLSILHHLQAEGHIPHVALAMYSPSRLVQTQALTLIKVVWPFTGPATERELVKALESFPGNAIQASAQSESSDSTNGLA